MIRRIKYITPFLLLVLLWGCQEVVEVNLDNTNPKLVVEGLITNQEGPYYVKLSTTGNFYSKEATPAVTEAVVTLADNAGNTEVLTHLSDDPGIYRADQIRGEVGRTYYLNIQYKGQEYTSEAYMPPVTTIDSLVIRFVKGNPIKEEGHYLYFYAEEPQGETNYYRWLVYENDSLYNSPSDLLIANDALIQGRIENLELPYPFQKSDTVRLEMQSLSKKAYEYYLGLQTVYSNDGGLFSPPPVNPPSVISNGALGIFRASAVEAGEVVIE